MKSIKNSNSSIHRFDRRDSVNDLYRYRPLLLSRSTRDSQFIQSIKVSKTICKICKLADEKYP